MVKPRIWKFEGTVSDNICCVCVGDDVAAGAFLATADVTPHLFFCQVMGNVPVTKQTVVYIDDSLRVMEDKAGELYIYAR